MKDSICRMDSKTNSDLYNEKKIDPSWYGSNASWQTDDRGKSNESIFVTFQSKDPIISIPMQEKMAKDKVPGGGGGGGGGHGHGLPVEHPTSYVETLMHLFKGNVGSGIFAMGDGMKNAGIMVGPPVVLLLGLICVHCQHLLIAAAKRMTLRQEIQVPPDFAETVELCFATGPPRAQRWSKFVKRLVNTLLCITQLGFCCVYFVFVSENFKQVLDNYGFKLDVHFHMAMFLLPILLTSLVRNLKYLAPFSTLANVLMVTGLIITMYFAGQDLPPISERKYVGDVMDMPLFFGTALFAFEGIGLVLPLQNDMKQPKNFKRPLGVLNVGMCVVTILYITVGFLSYLKYGNEIEGSVTLNLPKESILAQSVKLIIALGILLTYSLQFYIAVDITWPSVSSKLGPFKYPVFAELAFRSVLVLVTFILAEAIPYLNHFISLVGAFSSASLALLFPPMLELLSKYTFHELTPFIVIKDSLILLFGIIGCVTGTYESIMSIINAFQQGK